LTIEGNPDLISFPVVAPNIPKGTSGTVGFALYTDVDFNGIDVNNSSVTIAKEGPLDWLPHPGDLVDVDANAILDARGGLLAIVDGGPSGAVGLRVNGGTVFEDLDRSGICDPGEPELAGWTVELTPLGSPGTVAAEAPRFTLLARRAKSCNHLRRARTPGAPPPVARGIPSRQNDCGLRSGRQCRPPGGAL
jgi:hypothetical protein